MAAFGGFWDKVPADRIFAGISKSLMTIKFT